MLLEGRDGVGWRSCEFELQNVFFFLSLSCSEGVRVLPPCKPLCGLLSSGVGGRSLAVEEKALPERCREKVVCGGFGRDGAVAGNCHRVQGQCGFFKL